MKVYINHNPVLRKKSLIVKKITDSERRMLDQMLRVMYKSQGVGLAAVQVGILKQMIVLDIGKGPLKIINPKIIKKSVKKNTAFEGCLSLPGISVKVSRFKSVVVQAQDSAGKSIRIEAEDLLARALQHEIDHLQGKLIIDYLPWLKRISLKKQLKSSGAIHN